MRKDGCKDQILDDVGEGAFHGVLSLKGPEPRDSHSDHCGSNCGFAVRRAVRCVGDALAAQVLEEFACRALCASQTAPMSLAIVLTVKHRGTIQTFVVVDPERHVPVIPVFVTVEFAHDVSLLRGLVLLGPEPRGVKRQ